MKILQIVVPVTDEEKANHDTFHNFRNRFTGELNADGELLAELGIELLNQVCFANSKAHGWYEPYMRTLITDHDSNLDPIVENVLGERNFGEVMALITSEVSEAFEAYRDGDPVDELKYGYKTDAGTVFTEYRDDEDGNLGKPEGVPAELADVLIRVFDFAGAYGIPLGLATIRKHHYNQTRPYRHGGKLA